MVPNAGFVLKTRTPSGVKVFVNVCSHELVGNGDLSPPSGPVETQDKDGSTSLVYDVCCNDRVIAAALSDASGELQDKVLSMLVIFFRPCNPVPPVAALSPSHHMFERIPFVLT